MKRMLIGLLIAALCLTGFAAAECDAAVVCNIENGSYVIRIPDPNGDLGWLADDMAQDDSVVRLASEELVDDQFVVRYDPTGDGDVSVHVKHYTGIACDRMYGWDLRVEGGAVVDATGGSYTESGDPSESDPFLIGEWMENDAPFAQMSITKNEGGRGWDVEIASPMTHGAYIFKTTIYYDCELNAFVYDKGKFWDVPITDSEEEVELGEAKVAGTTGRFAFTGDPENPILSWSDDQTDGEERFFERAKDAQGDPYPGEWVSSRATMEIVADGDGYDVAIHWGSSYCESAEWVYEDCLYDEVSGGLSSFEVGVKTDVTYGENGDVVESREVYNDGAATFIINEEGKLVWTDFKETPGENEVTFERK